MKDPIPDGVAKGSLVTKKEFDLMLDAYFGGRGWNSEGIPAKEKLIELGLNKVAKEIGAA